eukprot:1082020-Ditylum_brightwellii.AAC.1
MMEELVQPTCKCNKFQMEIVTDVKQCALKDKLTDDKEFVKLNANWHRLLLLYCSVEEFLKMKHRTKIMTTAVIFLLAQTDNKWIIPKKQHLSGAVSIKGSCHS